MTQKTITINGLLDGISVVENDNKQEQPFVPLDKIFNDQEPITICSSSVEEAENFNPSSHDSVGNCL